MRRGDSLAIVGESGSGKSTLARCIACLIEPTSGEIWLDKENLASMGRKALRAHRRKVQVIFQDPYRSLNPRRTVGASIAEGPMNFGVSGSEARERAKALLALVGIDRSAIDRFPHQFSGGQRQRICIARALAMEPELLIADEAVSALDVSVQAQVLQLLEDIRKRLSLSILFITHDLRVAAQVCSKVAVMHHGRVVEAGDLADVFSVPRHEYTRTLLAAAPGRDWTFGVTSPAA
jgi:peptide/nickel transport system ATP-binding protein